MSITRREFMERSAFGALVAALPASGETAATTALPTRVLGRTGVRVPVLAFGCGSRFLAYKDETVALDVLSSAIERGITYLDTAAAYGSGESERRIGQLMRSRRQDVFLATKVPDSMRSRDEALRSAEASLKRLQTDRLDLLHLHSLGDARDLARIEAPDGALKGLYELRDQKVTRFIGMTSHTDGAVMAAAIDHNDLDCVQMAMNPARALQFEELALPAAKRKGLGVILMKVTAQEKLVGGGPGRADMATLVRYALTLPVATAVVGMPKPEFVAENIALVRAFAPLSPDEMDRVRRQVAPAQASVTEFFADHADA